MSYWYFSICIKRRDTLATIANRFNTSIKSILSINTGIVTENLSIGQVICISQEKTEQNVCPTLNSYVIRKGETFRSIAISLDGSLQSILNLNPNVDPNNLNIGQVICVPISSILFSITITTMSKTLTLHRNGRFFKAYPVATGKPRTPTPIGTAASNGCIRMYANDVADLFNYASIGIVVRIF